MKQTILTLTIATLCTLAGAQGKKHPFVQAPDVFDVTEFSTQALTPVVASMCVAYDGAVFAGVDGTGSLGKGPGKGKIIKLIDKDNDGIADSHTIFCKVDNPRGILAVGNKLFVLHANWIGPKELEGMYLTVFVDADNDGVADGKGIRLISDFGTKKFNQSRGIDHTTNGIRMGIDGWIYVACGDFGFVNAKGTDGTILTMYGGGVARVRPDGSELETYVHGLRNIYDVAIDPRLNLMTRGNTNDGGGWNIRFIHEIQSGEYGYPVLYKRYTYEMIPALVDVGGGSGTGAMFFQEPGWPEKYNNIPMMCDWGRSQLVIHRITPDGPTFTQKAEEFIKCPKITDVDCDASSRLYVSAWHKSGFKGGNSGFIARVTPEGWTYKAAPDLKNASDTELISHLSSPSSKLRLHTQQEFLSRGPSKTRSKQLTKLAAQSDADTDHRIAAIFTLKQLNGEASHPSLEKLTSDPAVREYALRALADRKTQNAKVSTKLFITGLDDTDPRVQVAAAVALGRLGQKSAAPALLAKANPPKPHPLFQAPPKSAPAPSVDKNGKKKKKKVAIKEGPHATPNPSIILPHIAKKALTELNATQACLDAIGGPNSQGALWALRFMYNKEAVDGLITKLNSPEKSITKQRIAMTLVRLIHKEKAYTGDTWWSTRPDTRGPFYYPTPWEQTATIQKALVAAYNSGDAALQKTISTLSEKDRAPIDGLTKSPSNAVTSSDEPKVDLDKIKSQKGQVGKMAIEDVLIALEKVKGNPKKGKTLFTRQGCIACHTLDKSTPPKGPYMGQIGSIMKADQIAMSILRPNAEISQGFKTVEIKTTSGATHQGFVTKRLSDRVEMRNIAGIVTTIKASDIKSEKLLPNSMMPAGLASGMSIEEFASLVTFLSQQK